VTRRSIGLALLTGGTLLTEVALTRALSISLFHHLAFLVVSTALLGTGAAGMAVTVSARLTAIDPDRIGGLAALGFAASVPLCFSLAQMVDVEPLAMAADASQLARLGLVYLLLAVPFFFSGLAVAALLDRFAAVAPRLYAADLLGAGAGSFLALLALSVAGSRGALLAGAALGACAAVVFLAGALRWVALAASASLALLFPFAPDLLPLTITSAKTSLSGEPFDDILRDPKRTIWTEETSIARLDLVDFGRDRRLFIDAGVAAIRIPPPDFRPVASDATLAYELRPNGRALIIGSGAGWEIAEALAFGAAQVDAVEISRGILEHTPASIADDPRVHLIHDEGRVFLERTGAPYDAIVMIHTISNAATSAGALHLAEDYLFTVEAMRTSLERLTGGGLLFITRPEAQLPRLLTTLVAALDVEEPADHLIAWTERSEQGQSFYSAVIAGRSPLSSADRAQIEARIRERSGLRLADARDPLIAGILEERPLDTLEAIAGHRLDPAVDDRPFFHQRRRFFDLGAGEIRSAFSTQDRARLALEEQPFAELSALLVLVETTLIGGLLLLIPILIARDTGAPKRRIAFTLFYFACLGLGFMLIEIALIQRLGLMLGRPAVAFATVFAGLLLGAGAGSRISERLPRPAAATTLAALTAIALAAVLPLAIPPALALPELARIAIALSLVLPAGVVLGMPFPLGLLETQRAPGRLVAWAFAANGVASIAGTVLALILATEVGFSWVLGIAAVLYALARATFSRLGS
jgi:hypothetical protein